MKTKNLKVLIADDDARYRTDLAKALFEDYETDFASNADEEIEKARQNKYALIMTDNHMEDGYGNSGIYAIEEIRKFDKEVPIIFHSANSAFEISIEALQKGANEVASKMVDLDELENIIEKYLTK